MSRGRGHEMQSEGRRREHGKVEEAWARWEEKVERNNTRESITASRGNMPH